MNILKEKRNQYILAILCILSLLPFFVIAIYSRPCADDFDYSIKLFHMINTGNYSILSLLKESFKTMVSVYNSWQGTYSSAIIMSLQTGIWGDKYYFIGIYLLIAFSYICLYKFFSSLNKRLLDNTTPTWLLSLLFLTLFIQTCPYINQCLYWQCGAFHYIPFFFLSLVVISYEIDYLFEKDKSKRIKYIIISSIISFIISGGNQVTSFINILILVLSITYTIYNKKNKGLCITLAFAIVGFVIMFIAPGNIVRQNANSSSPIIIAILNSFLGAIKYFIKWINIKWLLFIVLIVIINIDFINNCKYKLKVNPIFVIIFTGLLYVAMFCPTNYAISSNGPGRLKNVIYFALVIYSIVDVIYTLIWLKQKNMFLIKNNYKKNLVLAIIITLVVCFANVNFITCIKELKNGNARKFAECYDDRVSFIRNTNNEIVEVDPLPDSIILKFNDITNDLNNWKNSSWSEYYEKKTVLK